MLAYVYGIGRCAAEGYGYIENYVKKIGRIYIKCVLMMSTFENNNSIQNKELCARVFGM